MSIKVVCNGCNASFELKEELAGKKGKCPNCGNIIEIPESNQEPAKTESNKDSDALFSHNIYGIKQKKIAINEKYFIRDKDNNDLLFSIRKVYIMRGLFSAFTFFAVLIVFLFIGFSLGGPNNLILFVSCLILGFLAAIFMAIFVSPKKHIQFFKNDTDIKGPSEFEIKEDSKFQLINKTYTMVNGNNEVLCKFRKNAFTDVFRKKWHMEFDGKHLEVKEDSILLGLLRRFMPFGKLIRTNFIFTEGKTGDNLGIFKRKFELFDSYVLDLSNDIAYRVPRQLSLGMAILLDTGERR